MDDRTPEQRTADENLQRAIAEVVRVYDMIDRSTIITTWAVIGTQLGADTDGDLHSDFTLLPNNGVGMSQTALLGLLRAATLRAEHAYLSPGVD